MIAVNVAEDSPVGCEHRPPAISVVRTGGGYRIRCLECQEVGPEGENLGQAWLALRWHRRTRERVYSSVG
jgi:hypothetical protein